MDESQMRVLRHNVFKLTGGEGEPFQKGGKLQLKDEFNLMYRTEAACQGLREGLSKAESERHPWLPEWKLLAKRHNPKWSGQALPAEDIEVVVEQEKQDLLIHVVHAANPMLVVFWIQIVMKRLSTDSRSTKSVPDPDHPGRDMQVPRHGGGIAPPLEGQFYANIEKIELIFGSLELCALTSASRRRCMSLCFCACTRAERCGAALAQDRQDAVSVPVRADHENLAVLLDARPAVHPPAQVRLRDARGGLPHRHRILRLG